MRAVNNLSAGSHLLTARATDVCGLMSTSSIVSVTVLAPPQITVQPPARVTNIVGTTAQFGVTATGTAPLAYRWFLGSTPVGNGTNSTLLLPNVQLAQAGNYQVVITNLVGSVTSSVVALTVVVVPPSILTQPVGQFITMGGGIQLEVVAGGTPPLFYQWQFNGANLTAATNAMLTRTNLLAPDAGAYRGVVTNSVGSVTSAVANVFFLGGVQFYAGTIVSGPVGQVLRVDYADVVAPGTTNWLVLTNVTLPSSPYLVIDPGSAGKTKRFYRAVPVP